MFDFGVYCDSVWSCWWRCSCCDEDRAFVRGRLALAAYTRCAVWGTEVGYEDRSGQVVWGTEIAYGATSEGAVRACMGWGTEIAYGSAWVGWWSGALWTVTSASTDAGALQTESDHTQTQTTQTQTTHRHRLPIREYGRRCAADTDTDHTETQTTQRHRLHTDTDPTVTQTPQRDGPTSASTVIGALQRERQTETETETDRETETMRTV
eukprot:883253-Rhodomonas_salina.4